MAAHSVRRLQLLQCRRIRSQLSAMSLGPGNNILRQFHRPSQRWAENEAKSKPKESKDTVLLSDRCVKQIQSVADSTTCLRVLVEGGGCSGFQYIFKLDNEITKDDRVFEREGARVVVDEDSLEFVRGCTIDYHEELIRSAFQVVNNPQAEQGCSCGASFAIKM